MYKCIVYIAPFLKKIQYMYFFYSNHNKFKINLSSCLILDMVLNVKLQIWCRLNYYIIYIIYT